MLPKAKIYPEAIELVHELAEYLSRRFPTMFEIVRHSSVVSETTGWYGLPPIKSVRVLPLGKSYDLPMHPDDGENAAVRALEIASLMYVLSLRRCLDPYS
jgi:hypothetical protein